MIRLQASTDSAHLESCGIGAVAPQYGGIRTRPITSFLPAPGGCQLRWDESEAQRDRVLHRSSRITRSPRSPILHPQPQKNAGPRPVGKPEGLNGCGRSRPHTHTHKLQSSTISLMDTRRKSFHVVHSRCRKFRFPSCCRPAGLRRRTSLGSTGLKLGFSRKNAALRLAIGPGRPARAAAGGT